MARFLRLRILLDHLPPRFPAAPFRAPLHHPTVLLPTSQRWFAGSAVLEESSTMTQTSSESAGSAIEDGSVKGDARLQNEGGQSRPNAHSNKLQTPTTEKSQTEPSDNLSSLILSKLRGKNSSAIGQNENARSESNRPNASATATPEVGKSIDDNKWAQVMSSIRKIASKNRAAASSGKPDSTKMRETENGDDFADLDLPHSGSDASLTKNQSTTSLDNSFKREFTPYLKSQKGFQGGNIQRPKEVKLGNVNSLKPRDPSAPSARTDVLTDSSVAHSLGSSKDISFIGRSKDNWNQQMNKEVKPTSFEFLKGSEMKNTNIREDRSSANSNEQTGFQAGNIQRPKEGKLGNINFMKSRDPSGPSARTDVSVDSSFAHSPGSSKDIPFVGRSKDNWNQLINKETKPTSFEFLKGSETKNTNIREDRTYVNSNEQTQPARENCIPYSGYTVCVQDVPAHCNLGVVKYMLSTHGEVVTVFKKPGPNGSFSVYVEFKTAEAMDDALTVRQLQLEGKLLNIVRADFPITTVVRISRVSRETPENYIRSICEKYGNVDSIRRRGGNGVYDIFYRVKELPNIPNILESLNEVTVNQRRWIALPAPTLHPAVRKEVLKTSEGKAWHASQLHQMLNKIEMGLDTMAICFEDLKALTHMEDGLK